MASQPPHVNCRVTRQVENPSSAEPIVPNGVRVDLLSILEVAAKEAVENTKAKRVGRSEKQARPSPKITGGGLKRPKIPKNRSPKMPYGTRAAYPPTTLLRNVGALNRCVMGITS